MAPTPVFSQPEAPAMAPADASTVVLLAEGADGPKVLLLKRHAKSRFMAGAFVFPGGRVDAEDAAAAVSADDRAWCRAQLDPLGAEPELDEARAVALYVAGVRELFEEAGVWLGRPKGGDPADLESEPWQTRLADLRRRLNANDVAFDALLNEAGLEIDVRALQYWSHWITPSVERRRYDTRFFVAWLPEGQAASFDDKETTEQAWMALPEAVMAYHLMRIFLAPPTLQTIQELRTCGDRASIAREAGQAVPSILPRILLDDDGLRVLMPWDAAYGEAPGEGGSSTPLSRQARSLSRVHVWRPAVFEDEGDRAPAILQFWFGTGGDGERPDESCSQNWWGVGGAFDDACRKFELDLRRAIDGQYDDWRTDPQHDLARILLLDQMSRNIYRGTPAAFAQDGQALSWALAGIEAGRADQLPPVLRWFYFLPLMHAENIEAQRQQLDLYRALSREVGPRAREVYENVAHFAERHHDIVARFGRFPHRNEVLGRASTDEELAFLEEPGSRF